MICQTEGANWRGGGLCTPPSPLNPPLKSTSRNLLAWHQYRTWTVRHNVRVVVSTFHRILKNTLYLFVAMSARGDKITTNKTKPHTRSVSDRGHYTSGRLRVIVILVTERVMGSGINLIGYTISPNPILQTWHCLLCLSWLSFWRIFVWIVQVPKFLTNSHETCN